jgi:hypothetical protein
MAAAYTSLAALKTHMGISDTNDDTALSAVATAVNSLIEDAIGFAAADGGTAIRSYDGNGGDRLFVRGGLQGVTTLEVADATGGTFTATTDYVLKPYAHERPSGWPAWYVQLTDLASVTMTAGYQTVRITPATGWGFAAIPEELQRIADIMGARMFQARQSGDTFVVGSGDFGQAIVRFLPEPEYRDVLDHYAYTLGGKRRAS